MSFFGIGLPLFAEAWHDPDAPSGVVTLDGPLRLFHEEIRRIGTWRGLPLYMRWLDAPEGPMGAKFEIHPGVTIGVEYFVPKRVIPDPRFVSLWETERHRIRRLHAEVTRLALLAAASLIERLDGRLIDVGQGADLSRIPPAQGYHFPDFLRAIAKETP